MQECAKICVKKCKRAKNWKNVFADVCIFYFIIVTKIYGIDLMNSFYSSVRPNNPSAYRCQQGLRPDGQFRAAHHHV